MKRIDVNLTLSSYPIWIGTGIRKDENLLQSLVTGKQVSIVSNSTVASLYLYDVKAAFKDKQCDNFCIPDGEQFKTLATLETILTHLIEHHHDRSTTLCALGGGVVGDITGFAAACYQRGVDFIQMPTTLLAAVDAAIGGKTAVNHLLGKNLIGAFHQPLAVIIDVETLATLPAREFHAGLAEVVKYGLALDETFFAWLEQHADAIMQRDAQALTYLIEQSCQIKANVVMQDEHEQGLRALLNFGHTFAHALEQLTHYQSLLHGEAVAIGMVMAAELSQVVNDLTKTDVERVKRLLQRLSLPTTAPAGITAEACLQAMWRDKKVQANALRLILLTKIGAAVITSQFSSVQLEEILNKYLE